MRRHRRQLGLAGVCALVAAVVVYAVLSSPAGEKGAVLVAILAVAVPAATWAADRRSKHAAAAQVAPVPATVATVSSLVPPASDQPRLVVDEDGRIGGGDRAAALAYVQQLKLRPAADRHVRTAMTSASAQVVEHPDLQRARDEFERTATEYARGRVVYPWGPPSSEDWVMALETLWAMATRRTASGCVHWYAWPPGGAAEPVVFPVPRDDDLVRRVSDRFRDRPLHVQSVDPRIVWRWLAPAAVRSADGKAPGSPPVVLDEWRLSPSDPRGLVSVEPEDARRRLGSSTDRVWGW
jgi:hypothetical protein